VHRQVGEREAALLHATAEHRGVQQREIGGSASGGARTPIGALPREPMPPVVVCGGEVVFGERHVTERHLVERSTEQRGLRHGASPFQKLLLLARACCSGDMPSAVSPKTYSTIALEKHSPSNMLALISSVTADAPDALLGGDLRRDGRKRFARRNGGFVECAAPAGASSASAPTAVTMGTSSAPKRCRRNCDHPTQGRHRCRPDHTSSESGERPDRRASLALPNRR
jgi:hypothetical protein